ncbi:MAG: phospholipase, partial [Muribaculaceae bacterium]|nr:phospholipase [Muribaculaceae bacterium]
MRKLSICILLIMIVLTTGSLDAQIMTNMPGQQVLNTDSLLREFDRRPSFGLYKDNYFIFGIPTDHAPTVKNSNAKFQISISQRLTKSVLPWNTYLY